MNHITQASAKAQFLKDNLREGEVYAGLLLGTDGEADQHIILLPGEKGSTNWKGATEWAASIGGELPTRREQSLLFANLKKQFQGAWYWSSAQYGSYGAWLQNFDYGQQYCGGQNNSYRARAVRRLKIS